tara:strand:+ start:71 stop:727 length:657 start_codon:yes stop_codon:yes gene_type:complete
MIWLSNKIEFPPNENTTKDGVIALGGDLSTERLLHAYHRGIFPWYSDGEPIVWHSPLERMVLFPEELKISKSMRQILNKGEFIITENKAFEEVIFHCKNTKRKDEFGTWITDEMEQAYINLHKIGVAKSIEVWQVTERSQSTAQRPTELVGGLYGLEIGDIFCGESMFSKVSNASKVAFIHLVQSEKYQLIDCQVYNEHLASLGAREIPRNEFLKFLE